MASFHPQQQHGGYAQPQHPQQAQQHPQQYAPQQYGQQQPASSSGFTAFANDPGMGGAAPISTLLEPELAQMAGSAVLDQKYNSLTSQLAAQTDQFQRLTHTQQELQQRNAASFGQDRQAIEMRVQSFEARLQQQDEAIRVLRQQQDHILRVMALQDKVLEQDRLMRTWMERQQRMIQALTMPTPEDLSNFQTLQANQQHLLQSLGSINMRPTDGIAGVVRPEYPEVHVPGGSPYNGQPTATGHLATQGQFHTGPDVNKYINTGTLRGGGIVPYRSFDVDADAKKLRKAMRGLGTNERHLIEVICNRTLDQRMKVAQAFQVNYQRDLVKDMRSETSGRFKKILTMLMQTPAALAAQAAHEAIKGLGTDDNALIAVLCTKNNSEILAVKAAYQELFNKTLEADVRGDTSGWYQKLLVAIVEGRREETIGVNLELAKTDAAALYAAGEARMGTDEQVFIDVFTQRSFCQLRATFDHYSKLSDNDIERAVKKETSFNFKRALTTIAQAAKDPIALHARFLKDSMDGVGHDSDVLCRILAEHAEIDLLDIADAYRKEYKTDLYERIRRETIGNYRRSLLELFGEPHHDPEKDAKMLRKAMKGWGTNEGVLNKFVGGRRLEERIAFAEAYKTNYNRDILKDFNSETSGDYRRLLISLMKDHDEFAAAEVMRAVKGLGTDDRSLIELICTRSGSEMARLKDSFQRLYSRSMSDAVREDTSGDYRQLLLGMIDAERNDHERVTDDVVKAEAARLFAAGEARMGTDEAVFVEVFTTHSFPVLRAIFDQYAKLCDYDIAKSIKRETSMNFKRALVTIVRAVREPYEFFAEEFERTMKGAGTKDLHLIRLLVLHAETDLSMIADAYFAKYQRTLEARIHGDTSGNYRKLLLRVLHHSKNWCERFHAQQMHLQDRGQPVTHISITLTTNRGMQPGVSSGNSMYSDSTSEMAMANSGHGTAAPHRGSAAPHRGSASAVVAPPGSRQSVSAVSSRGGSVGHAESVSLTAGGSHGNRSGSRSSVHPDKSNVMLNISVAAGESHNL